MNISKSVYKREIDVNLQIALYSIIGLISFGFNMLIFLVITTKKSMRTRSNALLCNLALSDILISTFGTPPTITNLVFNNVTMTPGLCDFVGLLICTTFICSVLNLSLIAIHRYVLITQNKYYKVIFSNRNTLIAILLTWSIALTLSMPPLFGWGRYSYNYYRAHCMIDWSFSLSFLIFIQILCFPIPLIVLIFSYYEVRKSTNESRKRLTASVDRHNLARKMREHKLTSMLIAVVVCFFVCFTPYAILIQIEGVFKRQASESFSLIAMIMAYSNSLFDFWIYSIMSTKFRRALKELFKKIKRKSRKVAPQRANELSSSNEEAYAGENNGETPRLSRRRQSYINTGNHGNSCAAKQFYEVDREYSQH